jgi:hypothetical protein
VEWGWSGNGVTNFELFRDQLKEFVVYFQYKDCLFSMHSFCHSVTKFRIITLETNE